MSLMDTFVQVFEFDTSQADDAFNWVSKSTDDIIAEMKKAQQSATMGADGFTQFIQNVIASIETLSSGDPINIDIEDGDTQEKIASITAKIDDLKSSMNLLDIQRDEL